MELTASQKRLLTEMRIGQGDTHEIKLRKLERYLGQNPDDKEVRAQAVAEYFRHGDLTSSALHLLDFDPEAGLYIAKAVLQNINMDDLPRQVNETISELITQALT